jgi:hypothetical protein
MPTNLSANWPLRFLGEGKTEKFILDSAAAAHIYKGSPMMIDDNGDTDHVILSQLITVATSDVMVGIAAEEKVVVAGDAEDELHMIELYVWPTIIGFKSNSSPVFTMADVGKTVSMDGTGILTASGASTKPRIGKLFKVEDGYDYVALETPWVQA